MESVRTNLMAKVPFNSRSVLNSSCETTQSVASPRRSSPYAPKAYVTHELPLSDMGDIGGGVSDGRAVWLISLDAACEMRRKSQPLQISTLANGLGAYSTS